MDNSPQPQPPPTPRTKLVMPTKAPTRKLVAGAVGGVGSSVILGKSLANVVVYYLGQWSGHPLPPDIADAIGNIIESVVGIGLGIAAGYYTPPGANDVPVEVPADGAGQ